MIPRFTIRCIAAITFLHLPAALGQALVPTHQWPLDSPTTDTTESRGNLTAVDGVKGSSLVFDGDSLLKVRDSASLADGKSSFTLTAWVNPYLLNGGQQVIAAKNRYSLNERQWGVMIDKDNRFRLYTWQGKWVTADATTLPEPGSWYLLGIVVTPTKAELWVNGKRAGQLKLTQPILQTNAPITFGGIDDNGRIWQNLVGSIDQVQLFDKALDADQMSRLYHPVNATHAIPPFPGKMVVTPDLSWAQQIESHAKEDRTSIVFDGHSPDKLACDTTLRKMPDGSWVMIMLGGGDTEPMPQNRVFLSRSRDRGISWSPMEPIDLGVKSINPEAAMVPSELMVHGDRCTMFVATHDGTFADWKEWMTHSDDSCQTWSELVPVPGRLHDRTFIRNHIVSRDGRVLLPFQHYLRVAETKSITQNRRFSAPTNPRNGVLISDDGGATWTEHGNIRISSNDDYHGWAENNIVELTDGRIAMIIRADRLGGVLHYAESTDGGRTWPAFARKTTIPNPGSKATLYSLGGNNVALLHNPNPSHRSPLAMWVSFDGMQTWPYQRILVPESCDGPKGRLNYPDGFVSEDRKRLHFCFDDNRHRAIYVDARLPDLADPTPLWNEAISLPTSAEAEILEDVEFHVIKKWQPNVDDYQWAHGVALAWHHGKLYASFGHNKGQENTITEEARYCVSSDGGRTWSGIRTMDVGDESDDLAVSHGVLISHQDQLWAFLGAFYNRRQDVHTRAYVLDDETGKWRPAGVVVQDGFWPMAEPVQMGDGNWIMSGFVVGDGNPAAVAISQGDDLTSWQLVVIPRGASVGKMWGESSIIVDGSRVLNIARYGERPSALTAVSSDFGRTWSPSVESNLPMATSKPYFGVLSSGQRYLIGTTTADSEHRRSPLTIAVSKPGETSFSKVFVIRHADFPAGPGERHPQARLSYPYAIESSGKLYVGYSNSGERSHNRNSIELAVIPISQLTATSPAP